ncbi:MAG: hypothetical protein ABIR68_12355 [Ilumatobacteraceae bacterium]
MLIACALVVLLLPSRRSTIRATLFVGIADIGLLVGVSAPLGMAPLFFLWPLLFCAYFFPRHTLVAAFAVMVVVLAVAVLVNSHIELKADAFVGATSR